MPTGLDAPTGSRFKRLQPWLATERFVLTYNRGADDIDLRKFSTFTSATVETHH